MVRIMTDNAANLPKHLLEQYGIGELCLTYTIDGQPADISAEFDGRSFYEACGTAPWCRPLWLHQTPPGGKWSRI